jgi:hypothetical protein
MNPWDIEKCSHRPSAIGANNQGPKEGDEDVETYCARIAAKLCGDLDIPAMGPGAIDLTIEASGAPTCIQIGVHVLKPSYVYLLFLIPPVLRAIALPSSYRSSTSTSSAR